MYHHSARAWVLHPSRVLMAPPSPDSGLDLYEKASREVGEAERRLAAAQARLQDAKARKEAADARLREGSSGAAAGSPAAAQAGAEPKCDKMACMMVLGRQWECLMISGRLVGVG